MSNLNTSAAASVSSLVALQAAQKELSEKKKALREAQGRREWEAKTKAKNPQYIVGSLRPATSEDEMVLGHVHGWVCRIECAMCGKERLINKQDAFQVRYCSECKTEARKTKAKAKRVEKALDGKSIEDIEAEIAKAEAELAALSG